MAISAEMMQVAVNDLIPPGNGAQARREYRSVLGWVLTSGVDVKQCDKIAFRAVGIIQGSRDLNRIHIDSQIYVDAKYVQIEDTAAV